MKPKLYNIFKKIMFAGCFFILIAIFICFNLCILRELGIIIVASAVFFVLGLQLWNNIRKQFSLDFSTGPFIFFLFSWIGFLLLSTWVVKMPIILILGTFFDIFSLKITMTLLKKYNLSEKMENHNVFLWLIFTFSAVIPAHISLFQINHFISIIFIIIYVVIFGWFGPEMLSSILHGKYRPVLLAGAFYFFVLSFYAIMETINPTLKYITEDWVVVVFLSYIGCYVMFISRCISKILK